MKHFFYKAFKINNYSKTICVVFVIGFLLLSNMSVFAQTKETFIPVKYTISFQNQIAFSINTFDVNKENDTRTESLNFLNWFMGTKQSPNTTNQNQSNSTNTKAQIIQSGITPNRVLMKTFLKKAMNINTAYA